MDVHQLSESMVQPNNEKRSHVNVGASSLDGISGVPCKTPAHASTLNGQNDRSPPSATDVSDSEWESTTDTSIHSSPSPSEVPPEALEACDGLDDASFSSSSSSSRIYPQEEQSTTESSSSGTVSSSSRFESSSTSSASSPLSSSSGSSCTNSSCSCSCCQTSCSDSSSYACSCCSESDTSCTKRGACKPKAANNCAPS